MNIQVQDEIKACVASNCTIREALGKSRASFLSSISQVAWFPQGSPNADNLFPASEKYANDTCGIVGEDRTGLLFRMSVGFFAVAAAAFGLRCLERIRTGMWGLDDYVLAAVTVMMIPITIIMVLLSQAGLGLDAWNVSGDDIERVLYVSLQPPFVKGFGTRLTTLLGCSYSISRRFSIPGAWRSLRSPSCCSTCACFPSGRSASSYTS